MKSNQIILFMLFLAGIISGCSTSSEKIGVEELSNDWGLYPSNKVNLNGTKISSVDFDASKWTKISVPNTVLAGLLEAGVYKDIYLDNNLEKIETEQFNQPWWYRKEFTVTGDSFYKLVIEGINYRASIWLNGRIIADSSKIEGAFGIWTFDISDKVQPGNNVLAIEVYPPKPDDLTIGFVDWNPAPPDKNLGIWRPVKIIKTGKVSIEEPFVKSSLTPDLSKALLTISTKVTNNSKVEQTITLKGVISDIVFSKVVKLQPKESKSVVFDAKEFKQLSISYPELWWPNQMGEPNLYKLHMDVVSDNGISDYKDVTFGIRKIEQYMTDDGHRGYKINGAKVLIKGAGWVDDLLLADSDEKVVAQLEYVKHMGLNTVRLEGFWGRNKTLYEKADELGLLVMIGWSCHWEWEDYCHRPDDNFMAIRTPEDMELHAREYQDQVKWLRNHPSVFLWVYGSDKLPLPALEKKLNKYIGEVDGTRPVLASCKYVDLEYQTNSKGDVISGYINDSKVSGPTGVKMLGPYAYTPPNYWYLDTQAGGAYGFNTETGPGAQVPPLESIEKMISKDYLWPINDMWDYHSGRNEFANLNRYIDAFNNRYGEAKTVEDFTFRSQISNYEAIRAMFEAFEVNKSKNATGIVQWMLNSAWPEMFWQLYDWYLMPNGAFYGTKKANQDINAVYNYGDKNIYLVNNTLKDYKSVVVSVTVYDINSKKVFSKNISTRLESNSSIKVLDLPEIKDISSVYFIDLRVIDNDKELSSNFYWLSVKQDINDFEKAEWFYTPFKQYADFTQLNSMPESIVKINYTVANDKDDVVIECKLSNTTDKIAFFIELSAKSATTNKTFLPVFWDDNYISLLPGESRTIKARISKDVVGNGKVKVEIKGLNINR